MFQTTVTVDQFLQAMVDTFYMVGFSLLVGSIIGIPLGILLVITRPGGIIENSVFFKMVNPVINMVRSLPFIILLVAIIPFTRLIVQTSIGTAAAIVPLIIYVSPFIARLVENSILEVDDGIIEAAESMGATPMQTIWYFLVPEAMGSLILSLTTATISLLSATAMAGAVGGGGIGDLAISYGYERFDSFIMLVTVVVLIIFVQVIQSVGNWLAAKVRREN
ncbi:methionine ABC transporter permease [Pseudogracilibacillus auburnensis]|uniref:D-methionine transport system permease protein n=1 Tax=Pseudogracilibacillus auburnensis TaxID=1494959 RepID=A0A2V3VLD0_9BACI|nr:methionine ABC transporter permease [Pseudogracilibacillus auburnensis]MBO1002542.1 ABC transporter permease [Pseudogracilibacillus auburnensis]PXW82616.1 D-methionine transport system permease protein [Pseudogracilibacillus auburnensis]